MIMYMYKIHIGMVPDLGLVSDHNNRTGTKYFAKHNRCAPEDVKNIRNSSFFSQGPRLFNLLPMNLRTPPKNPSTPEEATKLKNRFKSRLDKWLELIPDEPTTEGLGPTDRSADSNSIVGQMRMHGREVNRKWLIVSKKLDMEEVATLTANTTAQLPSTRHQRTATHNQHEARVNRIW